MGATWVYAEVTPDGAHPSALELLTKARTLGGEIAAVALGSMIARFAELWLVENWGNYEFDHAAEQVTRLWANAIGLRQPPAKRTR